MKNDHENEIPEIGPNHNNLTDLWDIFEPGLELGVENGNIYDDNKISPDWLLDQDQSHFTEHQGNFLLSSPTSSISIHPFKDTYKILKHSLTLDKGDELSIKKSSFPFENIENLPFFNTENTYSTTNTKNEHIVNDFILKKELRITNVNGSVQRYPLHKEEDNLSEIGLNSYNAQIHQAALRAITAPIKMPISIASNFTQSFGSKETELWMHKYSPTKFTELITSDQANMETLQWILSWKDLSMQTPSHKQVIHTFRN